MHEFNSFEDSHLFEVTTDDPLVTRRSWMKMEKNMRSNPRLSQNIQNQLFLKQKIHHSKQNDGFWYILSWIFQQRRRDYETWSLWRELSSKELSPRYAQVFVCSNPSPKTDDQIVRNWWCLRACLCSVLDQTKSHAFRRGPFTLCLQRRRDYGNRDPVKRVCQASNNMLAVLAFFVCSSPRQRHKSMVFI